MLFGWDATRVGIERLVQILDDLPVILDDTKRARNPSVVIDTLYMVNQGRSGLRGTITGMQRQTTARTVLLSSGETASTSMGKSGGAHARILSLWGSPFGPEAQAELVDRFRLLLLDHYGHLGPRFVNWLIDHRSELPQLVATYRKGCLQWSERAGPSPVAVRAAEYLALLDLAAEIAHTRMGVPEPAGAPLDLALQAAIEAAAGADRPKAALAAVHGWATSEQIRFSGRRNANVDPEQQEGLTTSATPTVQHAPFQGWLGAWKAGQDWTQIAFNPERLTSWLAAEGFDADAVISAWKDRDWLNTERQRRTKRVSVDGVMTPCIVVRREAFDTVLQ